jgi:hypothetical protein
MNKRPCAQAQGLFLSVMSHRHGECQGACADNPQTKKNPIRTERDLERVQADGFSQRPQSPCRRKKTHQDHLMGFFI